LAGTGFSLKGQTVKMSWLIKDKGVAHLYYSKNLLARERIFIMDDKARYEGYWKANVRLITILLSIWALVSYGFGIILAPVLNNIMIGSIPLGFWFAQQGAMIVFVILIFVYCKLMDGIDKEYDVNE